MDSVSSLAPPVARSSRNASHDRSQNASHKSVSTTATAERSDAQNCARIEPSWLEACLGVPAVRLDATASNNTLGQCFESIVDLADIRIQVLGDRPHLPEAHIVVANHQSCLDAISLFLTLRRHMDWVIPVAHSDLSAPNNEHRFRETVSTMGSAIGTGDFTGAFHRLRAALVRFPILLSELPVISLADAQQPMTASPTNNPSKPSVQDNQETLLRAGSEVIASRKSFDQLSASKDDSQQQHLVRASQPSAMMDDDSTTPTARTTHIQDTLSNNRVDHIPQSHLYLNPRRQQLCLFPQRNPSLLPPQAGEYDPQTAALWDQTSSADAPTKLTTITLQYPNGMLPAMILRKLLTVVTGQRFHNVVNLHIDSPMTFKECSRRVAGNRTSRDDQPRDADQIHVLTTDYLAQQTRLSLKYLNNLGPNVNPSNTANYAKALCRLIMMGTSIAMVDWVLQQKVNPLLPSQMQESNLSRAFVALSTIALMRYTFSGTIAAKN